MADRHNNNKINKISGYSVGNDQTIIKHNHSNNNHFYRKKRTERKGTNSNIYGLIRKWRNQLKFGPQEQNQRGKNVPSQRN